MFWLCFLAEGILSKGCRNFEGSEPHPDQSSQFKYIQVSVPIMLYFTRVFWVMDAITSLNYSIFSYFSSQHALWTGGIWWVFPGEWSLLGVQQSWSALLCEWCTWHVTFIGCLSCFGSKCWPTLFPVLLEHQTLIYQSGHSLHHHSASGEADWQPHYQQSHCEDWRS